MAALTNTQVLKDTQQLFFYYNRLPKFREFVDRLLSKIPNPNLITFKGRPLRFYFKTLTILFPHYQPYTKFKPTPDQIRKFFVKFYLDPQGFRKLGELIQQTKTPLFSPQELKVVEEIDKNPSPPEKNNLYTTFLNQKDQGSPLPSVQAVAPPQSPTIGPRPKEIKIPPVVSTITKDALTNLKILTRKALMRYLTPARIAGLFSGTLGAILGYGAGQAPGAAIGGASGLLFPTFIKRGGGGLILGGANKALGSTSQALIRLGGIGARAIVLGGPVVWAVAGVILVLFLGGPLLGLLQTNSLLPPFSQPVSETLAPTGEAATLPSGSPAPLTDTPTPIAAIKNQFQIEVDPAFNSQTLRWTWEILAVARQTAPNFFTLLSQRYTLIKIKPTNEITNTQGNTIFLRVSSPGPTTNEQFFKQVLIHELGHVIYKPRFSPDPQLQRGIRGAIEKDGGYLTAYAQNSTLNPKDICRKPDQKPDPATVESEDFAETVSYYINGNTSELDYGCGKKNSQNPLKTNLYPNHLEFIRGVLGGNI